MRKTIVAAMIVVVAANVAASAGMNQVHAIVLDMSHLKLTSTTPHDLPAVHVDTVINNDIDVRITIQDAGTHPPSTDYGTLALRPGATPNFTWTCTSCRNGFFNTVTACNQDNGCSVGDVEWWYVGVTVNIVGMSASSYVQYDISGSTDLGNGKRFHVSPADCNTTVTPKDQNYSVTDYKYGWDGYTACSNNGVAINAEYE